MWRWQCIASQLAAEYAWWASNGPMSPITSMAGRPSADVGDPYSRDDSPFLGIFSHYHHRFRDTSIPYPLLWQMVSTDAVAPRILPSLTPVNRPYWTGGRDGRLLIAFCSRCRRF